MERAQAAGKPELMQALGKREQAVGRQEQTPAADKVEAVPAVGGQEAMLVAGRLELEPADCRRKVISAAATGKEPESSSGSSDKALSRLLDYPGLSA